MILLSSVVYNPPNLVKESLMAIKTTLMDTFLSDPDSIKWVVHLNDPPYDFDYKKLVHDVVGNWCYLSVGEKNIGNAAGYEYAWSLGEKMCKTPPELYVKADDDMKVLTPGWDKVFSQTFKAEPKLGILSADIDIDKMQGVNKVSEIGEGLRIEEFENPCVGGGFTAYSARMRQQIGKLNTSFGLYAGEDLEVCTRARAAGWRTAYLLNVRCTHMCRTPDGKYRQDADDAYGEWKRAYHARVIAKMQGCPEDQLPGTDKDFETWLREMTQGHLSDKYYERWLKMMGG